MRFKNVLRNIVSNWAGYIVTLALGFLLSPFVVHHLGNKGYGVWTLIASLTGYFGMLDLGIRSSVGRFVARYLALNDEDNVNRTVNTAVALLGLGGLVAIIATLLIYAGFGVFKVDVEFESAAQTALLIVGINIGVTLPLGVSGGILISLERFDVTTCVSIVGAFSRAGLLIFFLRNGYGLIAVALITLYVSLAESCASAIWARVLYRPLRLNLRFVQWKNAKELFGFSIYRFVWTIANQLIFYTDSIVIGIFLNAGSITYFAIAGTLINYGRNVVCLATDTFYPAATRLDSRHDLRGLRELQVLTTQVSLFICLPVCLVFLFLGRQFITLWMGRDYSISAIFLAVLTIPQFTGMSQSGSAVLLAGIAKHRILAFIALGEGVTNLLLSMFLVRKLGLIGVAWGTVIPHLISSGIIIPLYTLRQLNMDLAEYLRRAYLRPVLCAVPVGVYCYILSIRIEILSWWVFALEALSVVGIFAILAYLICLTAEQQASVVSRGLGFFSREALVNES